MWHRKKFIIIGVVGALLLAAGIGGIAYAQSGNYDGPGAMLDKVCDIYEQNTNTTIDRQALKDAFAQAREGMRPTAPRDRPLAPPPHPKMDPEAMKDRLQALANEGKISQEQVDQYTAWLNAKPDMTSFKQELEKWQQDRPEIPAEMKAWLEKMPEMPFGPDFRGHGRFPSFGGPCAPAPAPSP